MSFDFYEDDEFDEHSSLKYKIGDQMIKISSIESFTLSFAFDYLSLDSTKFCFNNHNISVEDYRELFIFKKEVSTVKIKDLIDDRLTNKKYHFHTIDLIKKKFLIEPLKKLMNYSKYIELYQLPTLYQLAVYTNSKIERSPRIVGFFGKYAVFHILWFDYGHEIYPRIKNNHTNPPH